MALSESGTILVTGGAGFIGFSLIDRLLREGLEIVCVDNVNDYYDRRLKHARLAELQDHPRFRFEKLDLADRSATAAFFQRASPNLVVHMAAQAGVRYSLENPNAYIDANLVAFMNILEGCRHQSVQHLVYASSSSVYGANSKVPFSVSDNVDHPVSLYAATKKANELMAHTYSHLYRLPATGLRFFTVYGPWMRPDMVPFVFADLIMAKQPIKIFNQGNMRRDFTYIDDIVEGIRRVMDLIPEPAALALTTSKAPHRVFNIGNSQPVELMHVITILERSLGVEAEKIMLDMQPGDVPATYADTKDLEQACGFAPSTPIDKGIENFVDWYRNIWQPMRCG